jgi:deoxyadenosine/deoxycytidine kinase
MSSVALGDSGPARTTDPKARVFIVEGEIAAGKTELALALADELRRRKLKVCLVLEPVELWKSVGILQKFYGDPARHGYSFQTYVFATRILAIRRAVEADPGADVYLLERSPATDQIFWFLQEEVVDPVERTMYHTWCQAWHQLLPFDLSQARVLYLRPNLAECMSRLTTRARDGELPARDGELPARDGELPREQKSGVSIEYQRRLREAHEAFLLGEHPLVAARMPRSPFDRARIVVLGPDVSDLDFRESGADRERVLARVVELMEL